MENTNKNTMKGLVLVLIATFFWATMGITSQNLNGANLTSIQVAFTRCLQAAVFTTIVLGFKNRQAFKVDWKGFLFCSLYGIIGFGLAFALFSLTVERLPIAVATVLMFSNPIWVTLFGKLFFNDHVGMKKLITISTCVFGCMLIINIFAPGNSDLNFFGVILGLLSGITFASQLVIPRFADGKYSNDTLLLYGFWAATIFLGFFSDIPTMNYSIVHSSDLMYTIMNLLAIGFLSTYIANSYYIKSTEYIGTTLPSILVAFEPIFAAVLAFFVLGETIEPIQIFGAFLVVVSVVVMQVDEVPAFLKKLMPKKETSKVNN